MRTILRLTCGLVLAGGCYVQTAPPPPSAPSPQGGETVVVTQPAAQPASAQPAPAPTPVATNAAGQQPIVCSSNEDIRLDGVVIQAGAGTAVTASGNCDVTLTNCQLSGDVGVSASGNSDVTLVGCTVQGSGEALMVSGNGDIHLENTTVQGEEMVSGNGEIHR